LPYGGILLYHNFELSKGLGMVEGHNVPKADDSFVLMKMKSEFFHGQGYYGFGGRTTFVDKDRDLLVMKPVSPEHKMFADYFEPKPRKLGLLSRVGAHIKGRGLLRHFTLSRRQSA
jgi:hypothetical protein